MACSKLFSGELPELTNEIIQYFRKDFSTLYSCILINRLWCRLAIPLLWEDPFSIPIQNYPCIEIYLRCLYEDDKTKLKEYGIKENLLSSNTLFNYPSFIKYINTNELGFSIIKWVGFAVIEQYKKLGNLIFRALFKVFIKNEGNLHSFEVVLTMSEDYNYLDDIMDLILQNPNLTCNIRNLTFRIYNYNTQNIITLLKFLYSNCNSITSIILDFSINDIDRSLFEKWFTQIIISQHDLKKISFETDNMIYNPFLSLKNSNCSNTLNTIIFYYIDFKNIVNILQKVFDQLNVLEFIHILYCDSLNSDFVQQIIKVNKPFKLRSLLMIEILHIESLQLLLQKIGDYLEKFGFELRYNNEQTRQLKRQLFNLIMKYCTKIRYFVSGIPDDNIIYLFIENNQHNISYLNIEVDFHENYTDLCSSVLQNLGQVLPSKLEYLSLSLIFNTSDLEIFLKNSQNTFIKKLLIKYKGEYINEDILFYIKKYIMKKERVKYLAILADDTDDELFSLKNEVNEFKLHNIIVRKHYNLYIDTYSFISNH